MPTALFPVTYHNPSAKVRLTNYANTIAVDEVRTQRSFFHADRPPAYCLIPLLIYIFADDSLWLIVGTDSHLRGIIRM